MDAGRTPPIDAATQERWLAKQGHYQDPLVVAAYDERRFRGWHARGSTARKWNAIRRELGGDLPAGSTVLDVPCGRGRFTRSVLSSDLRLVSADLSRPMLEAAAAAAGDHARFVGALQSDVQHLPFADSTFDLVMSIRFLFHVPPPLRAGILREMARVSKHFVVVDVRHRYCWTTHTKRLRARLVGKRPPSERASLADLDRLVADAGLVLRKRIWLAPFFSEKMLLVCEKR